MNFVLDFYRIFPKYYMGLSFIIIPLLYNIDIEISEFTLRQLILTIIFTGFLIAFDHICLVLYLINKVDINGLKEYFNKSNITLTCIASSLAAIAASTILVVINASILWINLCLFVLGTYILSNILVFDKIEEISKNSTIK